MDIDIVDDVENPMLHRRDVRFELRHDEATPSRLSVRDSLAAKLNKDADEVVLRELHTKYGMRMTVGFAKVYETAEHAGDVEQEYMLDRNKIGANGADAEAAEADEASDAEAEADAEEEAETDAEDEAETDAEDEAETDAEDEAETDAEDEAETDADEEGDADDA